MDGASLYFFPFMKGMPENQENDETIDSFVSKFDIVFTFIFHKRGF